MTTDSRCDVVLTGAGIMSATLGTLLKALDPSLVKLPAHLRSAFLDGGADEYAAACPV